MTAPIRIRSWVRASDAEVRTGMLGYISVFAGQLIVDGIVLRRTAEGRLTLSFPSRSDRAGRRHPYIRPVDDKARQAIEREILGQLAESEGAES